MSEMSKEYDRTRAARARKLPLLTALALWASPVMAGPPPGSPAVTVYVCIHDSFRHLQVSSYNSDDIFFIAPFETSPGVLTDTRIFFNFDGSIT